VCIEASSFLLWQYGPVGYFRVVITLRFGEQTGHDNTPLGLLVPTQQIASFHPLRPRVHRRKRTPLDDVIARHKVHWVITPEQVIDSLHRLTVAGHDSIQLDYVHMVYVRASSGEAQE